MKIKKLTARYLAWCADQHKPKTVQFYRSRLKKFVAEFGKRKFESLKLIEIEEHLARVGKGLSNSTRRHNIVAFNTLQNWALKHAFIKKTVAKNLKKPKAGQRDRIPTREETARILQGGSREFRLIYQALRHCGARPGELCGAMISDIKEDGTVIELEDHKTAGKTGKPRRILIGRKMAKIVRWATKGRTEGPIFLPLRAKQWTPERLSQTYRAVRDRQNLSDELKLYLARHEFATMVVLKHDIYAASKLLGHSNISTTQRYAHINEDELRKIQTNAL